MRQDESHVRGQALPVTPDRRSGPLAKVIGESWPPRSSPRGSGGVLSCGRAATVALTAMRVEAHYDIGNDLYTRMLDERMVYTCALAGCGQRVALA